MSIYRSCLLVIGVMATSSVLSAEFEDGFENNSNGATPKSNNDFFEWTNSSNATVSNEQSYSGSNSLKFLFPGSSDLSGDAWSEQKFSLQNKYKELWVRYKLWIPENYEHRNAQGPLNNKGLLMLWGDSYSGYSPTSSVHFQRDSDTGLSVIYSGWRVNGPVAWNFFDPNNLTSDGSLRSAPEGIVAADRGTWVDWVIHMKTSDIPIDKDARDDWSAGANGNGIIQVWKNGSNILNITNAHNYYNGSANDPGGAGDGWNNGYLLGWANSGFNEDTVFYLDDFKISDSNEGIDFNLNKPVMSNITISSDVN